VDELEGWVTTDPHKALLGGHDLSSLPLQVLPLQVNKTQTVQERAGKCLKVLNINVTQHEVMWQ
jgi:hypothetical protein